MKITNKHNLPKVMVEALTKNVFDPRNVSDNTYWLTQILGAPRPGLLQKAYYDEIECDVSDFINRFAGSAMHTAIEYASDNSSRLTEEKAYINLETMDIITLPKGVYMKDWEHYNPDTLYLTMKLDCYDGEECAVEDYKYTSAWGYVFENGRPKKDEIAQINCYAWAMNKLGFEIKERRLVYWYRDWSGTNFLKNPSGYPPCQIMSIPLKGNEIWSEEKTYKFIMDRVMVHQAARTIEDITELPMCSSEERWAKADEWKLMKVGRKTAVKKHVSEAQADQHCATMNAEGKGSYYVQHFPGSDVKCKDWCSACKFCDYWQKKYNS